MAWTRRWKRRVEVTGDPRIAIVGAGPYGLSIAAHLFSCGVETRVFGEPMGSWIHNMPKGMYLKSTLRASSLSAATSGYTLSDYYGLTGLEHDDDDTPVPVSVFIRYGLWFQELLVPQVERTRVRQISRTGRKFTLVLESGEALQAEQVVVASGQVDFAYVPPTLVPLMNGKPSAVSHSSQHADFSSFSRKEVAVIGSGQSALESAALLHEAGANVHLFARRPKVLWATPPDGIPRHWRRRVVKPPSSLGPGWSLYVLSRAPGFVRWLPDEARLFLVRKVLGPSGAWWLRDRVIGRINLTTDSVLESAALIDDRVVLRWRDSARRSREVVVDHVLAATGYRSNIDSLDFIDEDLRRRVRRVSSSPRLRHSFESSVPGLLFAGLSAAATFGPVLRFVCGADFAAHRITAALSERAKDS